MYEFNQIDFVSDFKELINPPSDSQSNAWCWKRQLAGNFEELVHKLSTQEPIRVVTENELFSLELTTEGKVARNAILEDLERLRLNGSDPVVNLIRFYERDVDNPFYPTDVYSFHADQSPVSTYTFLCTYYGATSEIAPNKYCRKKSEIPEYLNAIKRQCNGDEDDLNDFLREHFLDLHYEVESAAPIIKMELGDLWKLSVDHPGSTVPPCIHRAPLEKTGESRLLLIC